MIEFPPLTDDKYIVTEDDDNMRPFKCDTCGKAFSRLDYCKSHQRVHSSMYGCYSKTRCLISADKEGLKRHKCDICDRGFRSTSNLRNHIRSHSRKLSNVNSKNLGNAKSVCAHCFMKSNTIT